MYSFSYIPPSKIPWKEIATYPDHTAFKSKEWFDFIKKSKGDEPFIVEIKTENQTIGFFIGIKIRRFLFNIIASPFEGYTTSFQGLSLVPESNYELRSKIYKDLIQYLFSNHYCHFFQATDFYFNNYVNHFEVNTVISIKSNYVLDLKKELIDIYNGFSNSSCRYAIRKSVKLGVTIRHPEDIDEFIENYYNQLVDVFKKQRKQPTYSKDRVKKLIDTVFSSGQLLLLEARTKENICIATGIFTGTNKLATYWGGASYKDYQYLCPNEPLMFEAIKYWKNKNIEFFEFGGGKKYKEKYGPQIINVIKIMAAKHPILLWAKNLAKTMYYFFR